VADGLSIGTEIGDLEWLYMTLNGVWPPTRAIFAVADELFASLDTRSIIYFTAVLSWLAVTIYIFGW